MLLWDYLHEKAKFYCPPLSGHKGPVQLECLTINEIELIKPSSPGLQYAVRDDKMVDKLLEEMQNCIRDKDVDDAKRDSYSEFHLERLLNKDSSDFWWTQASYCTSNVSAWFPVYSLLLRYFLPQAVSSFIRTATYALDDTCKLLEIKNVSYDQEYKPPRSQSGTFFRRPKTILLQVEAPQVMEHCTDGFQEDKHELSYRCSGSLTAKLLVQVRLKISSGITHLGSLSSFYRVYRLFSVIAIV